ncbi:hypothetical protein F9B16_35340 [Actinomadura montaniterrae]|uniref:VCBS repeat-containing protein n=1 Tax=Actinomadura montaniterrae TaxID=1803903 RepID=A0A6L3VS79_9ACTN|nr:hypothetical protein F9B16_35340 [Actinomadura montaniterrae]
MRRARRASIRASWRLGAGEPFSGRCLIRLPPCAIHSRLGSPRQKDVPMTRRNRRLRGAALAAVTAAAAGTAGLSAVPAHAAPRVPAQPGDFNGDGHRDLALGSPLGSANGAARAGFVTVVYGSASGPDSSHRRSSRRRAPGSRAARRRTTDSAPPSPRPISTSTVTPTSPWSPTARIPTVPG